MSADLAKYKYSRRLIVGVLLLGIGLMAFFGWRGYVHYQHLQKIEASGFKVETLRGWMTMPYMAQYYGLEEAALYAAIGVSMAGNETLSLRQLIDKYQLDEIAARHAIEKLIEARQKQAADNDSHDRTQ